MWMNLSVCWEVFQMQIEVSTTHESTGFPLLINIKVSGMEGNYYDMMSLEITLWKKNCLMKYP